MIKCPAVQHLSQILGHVDCVAIYHCLANWILGEYFLNHCCILGNHLALALNPYGAVSNLDSTHEGSKHPYLQLLSAHPPP